MNEFIIGKLESFLDRKIQEEADNYLDAMEKDQYSAQSSAIYKEAAFKEVRKWIRENT